MAKAAAKKPKAVSTRREFLQLAETYQPDKDKIAGFFVSEKLDGSRCFWDGGISRGMKTIDVPWASLTDPKTGKPKAKVKPMATGLWSRYGNPIIAPDSFLAQLPACPLDGELWAGRGQFQLCRSIVAGDDPDPRFDRIQFAVYSTPPLAYLLQEGQIKNANMLCFMGAHIRPWFEKHRCNQFGGDYAAVEQGNFNAELHFLNENIPSEGSAVYLHRQTRLPLEEEPARRALEDMMEGILEKGGEGVIIRDPMAHWTPKRHRGLLKYKPYEDSEATIVGFVTGRQGKQGNVLGKIGTLVCETKGPKGKVRFEIGTGLTMEERELLDRTSTNWAERNVETALPDIFQAKHFKRGQKITFKFREWTDDGIPKEGRYWRVREDD